MKAATLQSTAFSGAARTARLDDSALTYRVDAPVGAVSDFTDEDAVSPSPISPIINTDARDIAALVASVRALSRSVARSIGRSLPAHILADLIAAGDEGALQAARRFRTDKECTFSTYAYHFIRAAVLKEFRYQCGRGRSGLSSPAAVRTFFRYRRAIREIESEGGNVTPETIAKQLDLDPSTVRDVLAVYVTTRDVSVDDERVDLGVADEASALDVLCGATTVDELRAAIERLKPREQVILRSRFYNGSTLEQVGAMLGLSKMGVCKLEKAAIQKLRRMLTRTRD